MTESVAGSTATAAEEDADYGSLNSISKLEVSKVKSMFTI